MMQPAQSLIDCPLSVVCQRNHTDFFPFHLFTGAHFYSYTFYSHVHCFIISILISFFLLSYFPFPNNIVFMMRENLLTTTATKKRKGQKNDSQTVRRSVCLCFCFCLFYFSVTAAASGQLLVTNRCTALTRSSVVEATV